MTGNDVTDTGWVPLVVQECRDRIRAHGFTVIAVGADTDGESPQFAYTVGVSQRRGFEFAVSGLSFPTMEAVLEELARKALDGNLLPEDGLLVEDVLGDGYLLKLRPVHLAHAFGMMRRVLGGAERPPVWQAQFPDKQGRHPGDPDCTLEPLDQADLTRPPAGAAFRRQWGPPS
jgi:hypothetical protein